MSPRRFLYLFLAALTVLRLLLIGQVELSPDEAYYYQWSERLDWSYFSKGPGVAVAMWLSTHLAGVSEFGVRLFAPLLALGTSLLMFSFARRLYGESVGVWAVVVMNCTPIFQVGGLVMTIDPLSIFFWMAAMYACWLALERSPDFSLWWPATGLLIGLGFLAKFTAAMQLLSVLLALAIMPKYRREFRRPGFYAMLGTFAVCTLPPIIWNARHDWITAVHLRARGGLEGKFGVDFGEWLSFVGAHFGVYSPLLFAGFCAALWWGWRAARRHSKPQFLLAFSLPLLALYLFLALKQAGEANWTAPAMLSLAVLATALWHERAQESAGARRFCFAALALGAVLCVFTVNTDALRALGLPLPYARDPGARLRGRLSAAERLEEFRQQYEAELGQPVFLIANNYGAAASLAFYLKDKRAEGPGHPPVYVPESAFPDNQYFFWPRYDENVDLPAGERPPDEYYTEEMGYNPFLGRTALYITERAEERPPSSIKRGFEDVEMIACLDQTRRGQPLRQLRIFACRNYKQIDL
jgi:4-amino-4-deoxy-L-arabinose transferase-like glycosyltransferase